jgi:hypothetical protein
MSIKVMTEVWDESPEKGAKLLVLLALADRANEDGVCWPRMSKVAERARVTVRGLQKIMRELEESGQLKVYVGGFLEGANRTSTFHVLTGRTKFTPTVREGEVLGGPPANEGSPPPRSDSSPLEPSEEPSREPSKPLGDGDAAASLPGLEAPPDQLDVTARDIFKLWQDICDRQDADYSPARQRAAKKGARESSDMDEWRQIVKGFRIFRERKAERDGAKPKFEFTEIVATHPGSGDLRSRLEFFKGQDDGNVHHDAVPSLLHDRITRRQVQVVEMFQQPDSRAVRERGEDAQRWLRENAGLVPVYDEQDGRVTWERVTT